MTSEADEADENAAGKFLRAEVIFDRCRVPIANDTMIKRPKAHVDTIIHFRLCFGCEASEIVWIISNPCFVMIFLLSRMMTHRKIEMSTFPEEFWLNELNGLS